jgi:general secretion pathway protein G
MKKTQSGFSLIELMAVIVILGILATIVAVNVSPFLQRANVEKIRADISQIEKAVELFKFNELTYPSTDQGIEALVSPPNNLKRPYMYPSSGYISKLPLDPWGNPYYYLFPSINGINYDIYTLGADGLEGGTGENADLGNWMQ